MLALLVASSVVSSSVVRSDLSCPQHQLQFDELPRGFSTCSHLSGHKLSIKPVRIIMSLAAAGTASQAPVLSLSNVPDTEATGEETANELTPHDMWAWNAQTHWKHWHGLWTMYQPLIGPDIVKTYKSVRSLWPVDKERIHLYHRNQWYATTGEGPDINWECGPWAMYEVKHSLPDGIWHPNSLDHRILQFPHGDLGWVQLALKPNDPKSVVFNELHFMTPSGDARMPVIMGYDFEGKLGVALQLEETRDNDKRPPGSWKGTLWKHHTDPVVATRDAPEGTFVGPEMSISTTLTQTTREAKWRGFRGGLSDEEAALYTLIHLPNQVTACVPKEPLIGKAHAYYVTWVVNENQVRILSARYFADGRLQYVKSGTYNKVSGSE
ncbi:hypothetical protein GOP47_0018783 [Adiantum capillus-veneris]|uniref:DUF3598 domain-containing protein n=1 Tax=Adiantum capillus-veneris TaxID=13818 RepID=A0A9D4Z942_ADICA|nr:hypothetical protein GOP47_0018783 [Adiantum capillus-veneris]